MEKSHLAHQRFSTARFGLYDNDAASLKAIAPADEARRWVNLLGGTDAVLKTAQDALDKKE